MSFVDREALSNGTSSMGLEKMVIPSILFHLVVIGLVIVAPIFPIKRVSYPSVYMVSLVSSSPGTPLEVTERRITKEAGKTKPVEKIESKPIRKIPKETPIKSIRKRVVKEKAFSRKVSTEKMISAAVERIKEEESSKKISEAISRVREESAPQRDEKNGMTTEASVPPSRGGIIASGTMELRFKVYYIIIWGKIREGWILPEGLVKNQEGLEAIISFKILRDGKIENIRFEKLSGNSYFDKSVLRAVEKADPLPPLPREFKEEYLDVGVRFHPSELS